LMFAMLHLLHSRQPLKCGHTSGFKLIRSLALWGWGWASSNLRCSPTSNNFKVALYFYCRNKSKTRPCPTNQTGCVDIGNEQTQEDPLAAALAW
jgi:hypothetical protein